MGGQADPWEGCEGVEGVEGVERSHTRVHVIYSKPTSSISGS